MYDRVFAFLDSAPGVTRDRQEVWEADRWLIGGKMFAMRGGDKTGRPVLTLKLPPMESDVMRAAFPGMVIPGYYMNKLHWSSLYLDSELPEEDALRMAQSAYEHFVSSLPKKRQEEIRGVSSRASS